MDSKNILVVEDDVAINNLLAKICTRAGYAVKQAFSSTEALLLLEKDEPDLLLLDLMIPGLTGEALISHIRSELALDLPIIVISAKVHLESKVNVLALGADDYMTKPFEAEEVLARIQAALRRYGTATGAGRSAAGIYVFGELQLDAPKRRVLLKDEDVALTGHEFDILHTLIQAPDTVFSRERLYELVWKSGYYGEDNTVNV
ncbi:MAG TPA: DNA-binding response regulator, partial [Coriobacteriia bacterium]|nr:DNA-binding response regulator [Coriobacteriia bacterium]